MLRRLMRRAIVQGRRIGIEQGFLPRFADVVRELMGSAYPELHEQRDDDRDVAAHRGGGVQPDARAGHAAARRRDRPGARRGRGGHRRRPGVPAARHVRLPVRPHARARGRAGPRRRRAGLREPAWTSSARARARARAAATATTRASGSARSRSRPARRRRSRATSGPSRRRRSARSTAENGRVLLKLVESPFYATGGGQVADAGVVECEDGDCRARVVDVVRVGDDQALVLEPERGELHEGERVVARVDPAHRRPTAVQPHRDAPAARGAARAARGARAPGRLLRRPGQAALRLHPRPAGQRRTSCATSRTRSTRGSSPTTPCARSRPRSTRPRRSAPPRCSARSTATSCGWSRSATAPGRASCAAARTCARPRRSACSR